MQGVGGATVVPACVMLNDDPPTVAVVWRAAGPAFAPTFRWTIPAPVPVAPSTIATQSTVLDDVQTHPAAAATWTATGPPAASSDALPGLSVESHPTPICVMVYVWPATVMRPVRGIPVFEATVNVAVPLPDELADVVSVIQLTLAAAVQGHVAALDVTVTTTEPPVDGTVAFAIATVMRQAAASCATVTRVSFTSTVACRGAGSALADTR